MKKYIIIAAAAIAAMACSKVETNDTPAKKVTFEVATYTSVQTKAHSLNSEDITSFNCIAFMKGEGVTDMQDFFGADGETISYKTASNTWEPSHDYYWPKSENSYVNFFSWYDTGAGPTEVTNGSMTWTSRVIGAGDNIMYADPAWHFQENTTNAQQYTTTDDNENDTITVGVPTLFHHALAQICVKAYAAKTSVANLCTWDIVLTDAAITNVYTTGSLTLSATEPATTTLNNKGTWSGTPAWSVTGDKSTIDATDDLTVTATTKNGAQSLIAMQSVLPQATTAMNLTFNLDITTTYSGTPAVTHHEIIPISIPIGTSAGFNTTPWALNTQYTYYVKVVPSENKVLFDPAVAEEWVGVDGGEKAI